MKVAGKSGISQARSRLGAEPMRLLYNTIVMPIAGPHTKGAWYRTWKLMSLDGSTFDVADTAENVQAFGRPGAASGIAAYPKIRFVALLECGTHVLCAARMGPFHSDELKLAADIVPALSKGMLCMADRLYPSYDLWSKAAASGADLLWRVRRNVGLPVDRRLADGSYLSRIGASKRSINKDGEPLTVRVIEYELKDVAGAEPIYRLMTTILDPDAAPASELAALYPERWEIETALDELKTHLRGRQIVLRSKMPELVEQEFYGLLLAHYAIRGLMHEAALQADEDPDRISFVHTVRVVRRRMSKYGAIPPSREESISPGDD